MTIEEYGQFLTLKNRLQPIAKERLKEYCEIIGRDDSMYLTDITFYDASVITFEGDQEWGCGDTEHHYLEMPIQMIFDETYPARLRYQLETERIEKERKAMEREAQADLLRQEKSKRLRRQQYEKLKKEFETA
jgi:hypothetical protein